MCMLRMICTMSLNEKESLRGERIMMHISHSSIRFRDDIRNKLLSESRAETTYETDEAIIRLCLT